MGALTCGAGPQERSCCSLQLGEPGWRAMVERAALLYLKSQVETGFDLYVVGKMIVSLVILCLFSFSHLEVVVVVSWFTKELFCASC